MLWASARPMTPRPQSDIPGCHADASRPIDAQAAVRRRRDRGRARKVGAAIRRAEGAAHRGRHATQARAGGRADGGGSKPAQGPAWPALRRRPVPRSGPDHPGLVPVRDQTSLRGGKPFGSRAHGGRGNRRLRAWPDGSRLRHRSPVCSALQTNRVGRVDRGGDPLLLVGYGAQGRARDAIGR